MRLFAPLAFVLFCACSDNQKQYPCAEFEDTIYHFGQIETKDAFLHHDFKFTNRGGKPLIIFKADGSCDCVTADFEMRPILPGETSVVTVNYDASHYGSIEFYETVRLITNIKEIYLDIDGEIISPD